MRAVLIPADSGIPMTDVVLDDDGGRDTLRLLREHIECDLVTTVPVVDTALGAELERQHSVRNKLTYWADDEGLYAEEVVYNMRASLLLGMDIVGNVVVTGHDGYGETITSPLTAINIIDFFHEMLP